MQGFAVLVWILIRSVSSSPHSSPKKDFKRENKTRRHETTPWSPLDMVHPFMKAQPDPGYTQFAQDVIDGRNPQPEHYSFEDDQSVFDDTGLKGVMKQLKSQKMGDKPTENSDSAEPPAAYAAEIAAYLSPGIGDPPSDMPSGAGVMLNLAGKLGNGNRNVNMMGSNNLLGRMPMPGPVGLPLKSSKYLGGSPTEENYMQLQKPSPNIIQPFHKPSLSQQSMGQTGIPGLPPDTSVAPPVSSITPSLASQGRMTSQEGMTAQGIVASQGGPLSGENMRVEGTMTKQMNSPIGDNGQELSEEKGSQLASSNQLMDSSSLMGSSNQMHIQRPEQEQEPPQQAMSLKPQENPTDVDVPASNEAASNQVGPPLAEGDTASGASRHQVSNSNGVPMMGEAKNEDAKGEDMKAPSVGMEASAMLLTPKKIATVTGELRDKFNTTLPEENDDTEEKTPDNIKQKLTSSLRDALLENVKEMLSEENSKQLLEQAQAITDESSLKLSNAKEHEEEGSGTEPATPDDGGGSGDGFNISSNQDNALLGNSSDGGDPTQLLEGNLMRVDKKKLVHILARMMKQYKRNGLEANKEKESEDRNDISSGDSGDGDNGEIRHKEQKKTLGFRYTKRKKMQKAVSRANIDFDPYTEIGLSDPFLYGNNPLPKPRVIDVNAKGRHSVHVNLFDEKSKSKKKCRPIDSHKRHSVHVNLFDKVNTDKGTCHSDKSSKTSEMDIQDELKKLKEIVSQELLNGKLEDKMKAEFVASTSKSNSENKGLTKESSNEKLDTAVETKNNEDKDIKGKESNVKETKNTETGAKEKETKNWKEKEKETKKKGSKSDETKEQDDLDDERINTIIIKAVEYVNGTKEFEQQTSPEKSVAHEAKYVKVNELDQRIANKVKELLKQTKLNESSQNITTSGESLEKQTQSNKQPLKLKENSENMKQSAEGKVNDNGESQSHSAENEHEDENIKEMEEKNEEIGKATNPQLGEKEVEAYSTFIESLKDEYMGNETRKQEKEKEATGDSGQDSLKVSKESKNETDKVDKTDEQREDKGETTSKVGDMHQVVTEAKPNGKEVEKPLESQHESNRDKEKIKNDAMYNNNNGFGYHVGGPPLNPKISPDQPTQLNIGAAEHQAHQPFTTVEYKLAKKPTSYEHEVKNFASSETLPKANKVDNDQSNDVKNHPENAKISKVNEGTGKLTHEPDRVKDPTEEEKKLKYQGEKEQGTSEYVGGKEKYQHQDKVNLKKVNDDDSGKSSRKPAIAGDQTIKDNKLSSQEEQETKEEKTDNAEQTDDKHIETEKQKIKEEKTDNAEETDNEKKAEKQNIKEENTDNAEETDNEKNAEKQNIKEEKTDNAEEADDKHIKAEKQEVKDENTDNVEKTDDKKKAEKQNIKEIDDAEETEDNKKAESDQKAKEEEEEEGKEKNDEAQPNYEKLISEAPVHSSESNDEQNEEFRPTEEENNEKAHEVMDDNNHLQNINLSPDFPTQSNIGSAEYQAHQPFTTVEYKLAKKPTNYEHNTEKFGFSNNPKKVDNGNNIHSESGYVDKINPNLPHEPTRVEDDTDKEKMLKYQKVKEQGTTTKINEKPTKPSVAENPNPNGNNQHQPPTVSLHEVLTPSTKFTHEGVKEMLQKIDNKELNENPRPEDTSLDEEGKTVTGTDVQDEKLKNEDRMGSKSSGTSFEVNINVDAADERSVKGSAKSKDETEQNENSSDDDAGKKDDEDDFESLVLENEKRNKQNAERLNKDASALEDAIKKLEALEFSKNTRGNTERDITGKDSVSIVDHVDIVDNVPTPPETTAVHPPPLSATNLPTPPDTTAAHLPSSSMNSPSDAAMAAPSEPLSTTNIEPVLTAGNPSSTEIGESEMEAFYQSNTAIKEKKRKGKKIKVETEKEPTPVKKPISQSVDGQSVLITTSIETKKKKKPAMKTKEEDVSSGISSGKLVDIKPPPKRESKEDMDKKVNRLFSSVDLTNDKSLTKKLHSQSKEKHVVAEDIKIEGKEAINSKENKYLETEKESGPETKGHSETKMQKTSKTTAAIDKENEKNAHEEPNRQAGEQSYSSKSEQDETYDHQSIHTLPEHQLAEKVAESKEKERNDLVLSSTKEDHLKENEEALRDDEHSHHHSNSKDTEVGHDHDERKHKAETQKATEHEKVNEKGNAESKHESSKKEYESLEKKLPKHKERSTEDQKDLKEKEMDNNSTKSNNEHPKEVYEPADDELHIKKETFVNHKTSNEPSDDELHIKKETSVNHKTSNEPSDDELHIKKETFVNHKTSNEPSDDELHIKKETSVNHKTSNEPSDDELHIKKETSVNHKTSDEPSDDELHIKKETSVNHKTSNEQSDDELHIKKETSVNHKTSDEPSDDEMHMNKETSVNHKTSDEPSDDELHIKKETSVNHKTSNESSDDEMHMNKETSRHQDSTKHDEHNEGSQSESLSSNDKLKMQSSDKQDLHDDADHKEEADMGNQSHIFETSHGAKKQEKHSEATGDGNGDNVHQLASQNESPEKAFNQNKENAKSQGSTKSQSDSSESRKDMKSQEDGETKNLNENESTEEEPSTDNLNIDGLIQHMQEQMKEIRERTKSKEGNELKEKDGNGTSINTTKRRKITRHLHHHRHKKHRKKLYLTYI